MQLKLVNIGFQPDRFAEIELVTDFLQCLKDHGGSGKCIVADADCGILQHPVFFKYFSPHAEHLCHLFLYVKRIITFSLYNTRKNDETQGGIGCKENTNEV